jgi:hypothetical protein
MGLNETTGFPLSPSQLKMLRCHEVFNGPYWVTVPLTIAVPDDMDETRIGEALQDLSTSYEALRTKMYKLDGGRGWRQIVLPVPSIEQFAGELREPPVTTVDPEGGCLRVSLQTDGQARSLTLLIHHSVCDAASVRILDERLSVALYHPAEFRAQALNARSGVGGAPLQPREMVTLECSERAQRNTQEWLEFHRSKRQWSDLDASVLEAAGPPPDSLRLMVVVPEFAFLLAVAARKTGGTAESVLVGLLSRFVLAQRRRRNDLSLRVMCGNRFMPQVQQSVAQVANEVWVRIGAANSAEAGWYAGIHRELLRAYRKGFYDWPKVQEELPFPRRMVSVDHLRVNVIRGIEAPAGGPEDFRDAVRVLRERPLSQRIEHRVSPDPDFLKNEVELDCYVDFDHRTGRLTLLAQAPRWREDWADSLLDWLVEELVRLLEPA